jgi:hypothetical protein
MYSIPLMIKCNLFAFAGLGSFPRRNPRRHTRYSPDRHIKMCTIMENCIHPRSDGQLDRVYVYPHGYWITLLIKQDGGNLFSYLCFRHAWLRALYRKLIHSSFGHDARSANDHNGFRDEKSATRNSRQYSRRSSLRRPLLLLYSRYSLGQKKCAEVNWFHHLI